MNYSKGLEKILKTIRKGDAMRTKILLIFCGLFLLSSLSQAQDKVDLIIINERLVKIETKVEEGQKAINQRIDDINKRFNDQQINFNNRFDDIMTWLQIMTTILGLVFVGIFGTLLLGWRKITSVEAKVNEAFRFEERDRMQVIYEEGFRKVENQIKEIRELVAR